MRGQRDGLNWLGRAAIRLPLTAVFLGSPATAAIPFKIYHPEGAQLLFLHLELHSLRE
jgi:hypothetical protein